MTDCVSGKILKFANDTKIYRTVISAEDVSALQSDLSNFVAWSKEWQMLFNVEKCFYVYRIQQCISGVCYK